MSTNSLVDDAEDELRSLSATRYRDLRAPRATALEERLGRKGGFCDCEIFMNGFELAPPYWLPAQQYVEDGIAYETDPSYPDPLPSCLGVSRGSTQGCGLWVPQRRGWG